MYRPKQNNDHDTAFPLVWYPEKFFQNPIISFLDTLSQKNIFFIIKINNFWGDLSGISAKTATLVVLESIAPADVCA